MCFVLDKQVLSNSTGWINNAASQLRVKREAREHSQAIVIQVRSSIWCIMYWVIGTCRLVHIEVIV